MTNLTKQPTRVNASPIRSDISDVHDDPHSTKQPNAQLDLMKQVLSQYLTVRQTADTIKQAVKVAKQHLYDSNVSLEKKQRIEASIKELSQQLKEQLATFTATSQQLTKLSTKVVKQG